MGQGTITFETRKTDVGPHKWEARIHQRNCVWIGDTEQEALTNLVNGVAELAAGGSIDPRRPDEPGPILDGPVQQCIELLERKLKMLILESADAAQKSGTDSSERSESFLADDRRRLQESRRVIGNIGTALAALCRVESN